MLRSSWRLLVGLLPHLQSLLVVFVTYALGIASRAVCSLWKETYTVEVSVLTWWPHFVPVKRDWWRKLVFYSTRTFTKSSWFLCTKLSMYPSKHPLKVMPWLMRFLWLLNSYLLFLVLKWEMGGELYNICDFIHSFHVLKILTRCLSVRSNAPFLLRLLPFPVTFFFAHCFSYLVWWQTSKQEPSAIQFLQISSLCLLLIDR